MSQMAKNAKMASVGDVLVLLRQVPLSVYLLPMVVAVAAYVLLGAAIWLLVTPFWKELAGEWDIVGRFVAVIAWVIGFPVIFNVLLSLVIGIAFDPLASKVDQLLHIDQYKVLPLRHQCIDSIIRAASLLALQVVAAIIGLAVPVLGLVISGFVTVITALILMTTPAATHRGLRFSAHLKLMAGKIGLREVVFGTVSAVMLTNPLLQVISLVPLVIFGQLVTQSWLADRFD